MAPIALLSLAALAAALVPSAFASCACTGNNLGVNTAIHGQDFGTRCAAWDDGTFASNTKGCEQYDESDVGYWCCRPWCYIDASTCDGSETPFMSSFVQEGNDPTLFYSFAACEAEGVEAEVSFSTPEACPFKGPAAYEPPVRVIAYIRDKNEGDDSAFGCDYCHHLQSELGSLRNLVEPTLSAQGKPVLSSTFTSSSREKFERWYSDDVCSVVAPLVFDWNINSDLHVFDTNDFLPLGQHVEPRGLFTSEMSVFFQYNTGEIFNFLGDDDVWVFINSQLVIDLGGCHGAEYASVELDEVADEIGLTPGGTYELKVFHAERCYGASNFKAEMTLRQDQGVCPKECNAFRKYGYCDTESGRCVCIDGIGGADCGTCLGEDWCAEKGAKEGEVCPSVWLCDYTGVAREGGVVCVEEEEENLSGGGGGGGISEALTVVATLTAALLTF